MQCGHSWKAALFEGWKLHHNPNKEVQNEISEVSDCLLQKNAISKEMEGNENRDIWKTMAIKYCEQVRFLKVKCI